MWVHGIDLAQEADFDLGSLRVRPARCEVEWNGVSQTLQRRVMQVLVALAQARGSVVSQDDLVIRCWRGLSVSDDAIYRCISKLRKLAADYPDAPFAIEAIPGVGYRLTSPSLVEHDPAVEPTGRHPASRLSRLGAAAALAILVLAGAAFWMFHDRARRSSSASRRGPAVRNAEQFCRRAFPRAKNSQRGRERAWRQPDCDSIGRGGGPQAKPAPAPALIVTGLVRDDAPNLIVDVRIEDGTTRAAFWSMEFKRDRREASDLPMEVAARVADVVNMAIFARSANPPLTDDSALSALLQTNDMIRDTHGGDWAQMIERAQGVVARHPEFAFGHDVLAAAYAEASESIDIPDRAQAMKEAARQGGKPDAQARSCRCWCICHSVGARADLIAREEAMLLRGIKYAKHPKGAAWRIILIRGHIAQQCRASARSPVLPIDRACDR